MNRYGLACPKCSAPPGSPCVNLLNRSERRTPHVDRRTPAECGTYAAYQQHTKRGEDPDEACREANRVYMQTYREDPDNRAKQNALNAAYSRAVWVLADRHRDEFAQIVREIRDGVPS